MVMLEGQLKEVMYKQCVTMMMIYVPIRRLVIYMQVGHSYMGITFESTFKTDNVAELRTYREVH